MIDDKLAKRQYSEPNQYEFYNNGSTLQRNLKIETKRQMFSSRIKNKDFVKLALQRQNQQTQSFHNSGTQTEKINSDVLNYQIEKNCHTQEQEDLCQNIIQQKRYQSLNRNKKSLSIFQNNIIYGALINPQCSINRVVEFKLPKLDHQMNNNCQKVKELQQLSKVKKNQIQKTLQYARQSQQSQFSQLILPPIQSVDQTTNLKSKVFSEMKKERFQKFNSDLKERIFKIQDTYINKIPFSHYVPTEIY